MAGLNNCGMFECIRFDVNGIASTTRFAKEITGDQEVLGFYAPGDDYQLLAPPLRQSQDDFLDDRLPEWDVASCLMRIVELGERQRGIKPQDSLSLPVIKNPGWVLQIELA